MLSTLVGYNWMTVLGGAWFARLELSYSSRLSSCSHASGFLGGGGRIAGYT